MLDQSALRRVLDGWVKGIPNDDYHQGPGLSSTDLKLLNLSPAHFKAKDLFEETDPLIVGSAFHTMMLEPANFFKEYQIMAEGEIRSKKKKEKAAEEGIRLLTHKHGQGLRQYQTAILQHKQARHLYGLRDKAIIEQSGYWKHPKSGILLKIRPDVRIPSMGLMWDLKTIGMRNNKDLQYKFENHIAEFSYHLSAAMYLKVANAIEGAQVYTTFVWIVVAKEPPYMVGVYVPNTQMLEQGRGEMVEAMEIYQECLDSGKWPKPDTGDINVVSLPKWKQRTEVIYD